MSRQFGRAIDAVRTAPSATRLTGALVRPSPAEPGAKQRWFGSIAFQGGSTMAPKSANGKICYLEIPTADIARSVSFYQAVFGWVTRRRGDGATAFDDGAGEVSGGWVTGRPSSPTPGLLL